MTIFQDLKVIELASALAGPSVGMFFAELGAEVIKIENKKTGGDVTRRWKHPNEDQNDPYSAYYHSTNWGKKTLMLDLKQPQAYNQVLAMLKTADIVVANFKPGSAARLGLDYEALKKINSRLIYANVTAYGPNDPRPGFDALMQAAAGWMSINGQADGPPTKLALPMIDILAGHQLKEGTLVALLNRHKTGRGSQVNVSLYDAALAALANQSSTYLNLHVSPTRIGSQHPSIAPYGDMVTTSDGIDFLLAVGTEQHFKSLCEVANLPELYSDTRYNTNGNRLEHRRSLVDELQLSAGRMTSDEFEKACNLRGVPIGAIKHLSEVLEEPAAKSLILEEIVDGKNTKRVKTAVFKII